MACFFDTLNFRRRQRDTSPLAREYGFSVHRHVHQEPRQRVTAVVTPRGRPNNVLPQLSLVCALPMQALVLLLLVNLNTLFSECCISYVAYWAACRASVFFIVLGID